MAIVSIYKSRKLVLHKGTSHRHYKLIILKYKKGFKIQSIHGRIGGYETATTGPKKGYKRVTTLVKVYIPLPEAIEKFKKQIMSKKKRGYK